MPAFPSQGLPWQGHVGASHPPQPPMVSTRWPSAPSPRPSQPQRSRQHPLVFIFEQKKPPPAPATETAAASAPQLIAADIWSLPTPARVTAQAAAEANPWVFLEKRSKPGCAQLASPPALPSSHSSFAPATQQSPRRENSQQHSKNAPLVPSPSVPSQLPTMTPEESQGATGAGVSPPCLEIISLKEGLAIMTFPRLNQSRPPGASVPTRAQAQPPPGAAGKDRAETPGTHGGTGSRARGRAPRSAPLVRWLLSMGFD